MNILSALQAGYSPEKVLNYIKKIDPDLALKINTALQAGHTIESVLNYFSKMGSKISSMLGKPVEKSSNLYLNAQSSIHPFISGAAQGAGILGAGAVGSYALGRAIPQTAQAVAPELISAASATPPPFPPSGLTPTPPIAPTAVSESASIASSATPPSPPPAPLPDALKKQASALLEAGNNIDQVEGALKSTNPKIVKEYEKATNSPIKGAIEEYSKTISPSQQPPSLPSGMQKSNEPSERKAPQSLENEKDLNKTENIEKKKGTKVALPDGNVGEITDIRQGIATVDANGKEYRRKLDELIESPVPEKDLADIYSDLISRIKKETGQEVSRAINYVGFNPDQKSLIVNYSSPGADTYVFSDLHENRIKQLLELQQLRRTSGNNYIGGWEQGTKSVFGSKMHDLVKELEAERGGKGKAHEFTYKTLYDALEPAKIAKKEQIEQTAALKRTQKKLEKEKQEKENAKKRKAKKPRLD